jgi:hypothetical protein
MRRIESSDARSAAIERLTGRTALYLAALLGAALSLVLFVVEVGNVPDIEVGDPVEERRGEVSVVTFEVTNNADEPLCPEIRVAARDREAHDLAEAVASPAGAPGHIAPGTSLRYTASLEIDPVEYDEEVQEIRPYVYEIGPCAP